MFPVCEALAARPHLISIAFDQRNHGIRLLEAARNGGWENPTHVNDMFSTQYGTSRDVSFLMDLLPSFIGFKPRSYGVVGVSLGGHVALLTLGLDRRVAFAVSIIGCGDYQALMTRRAAANAGNDEEKDVMARDPTLKGRLSSQLRDLLTQVDPVHRSDCFFSFFFHVGDLGE